MLNAWKYVTVISWREVTPNALSIVKKNAEKVPDNDSNWISRTEQHWFKPPKSVIVYIYNNLDGILLKVIVLAEPYSASKKSSFIPFTHLWWK